MRPIISVAAKAFIVCNGKVLLIRESSAYMDGTNVGKYDLPGGRITPGEHYKESLVREVEEETGLAVRIGKPFFVSEWRPRIKGEQWHIVGIFFECHADSENCILGKDHDHFFWIAPEDYARYDLIENLRPVFEEYMKCT